MATKKKLKLTDDQLEKLTSLRKEIELRQLELGRLEVLKTEIISGIYEFNKQFEELKNEILSEHGDCEVDLNTGIITKKEPEAN